MSKLQARLLTEAVLPALEDLPKPLIRRAGIPKGWNWAAAFGLRFSKPIAIRIQGHNIHVKRRKAQSGELNLVFLTPDSLVRAFTGRIPVPPPIPTGGFGHLSGMKKFESLGKELKKFLESSRTGEADLPALRAAFGVVCRALPIMVDEDELSLKTLKGCKPSTAWVVMKPLEFEFGVVWDGSKLETSDERPEETTVDLTFETLEAVRQAASGTLDFQAAVGKGDIRVSGDVLFADALGVVMDRADEFLQV